MAATQRARFRPYSAGLARPKPPCVRVGVRRLDGDLIAAANELARAER
jgi:hypothetical protein